jgi:hypothetical protein
LYPVPTAFLVLLKINTDVFRTGRISCSRLCRVKRLAVPELRRDVQRRGAVLIGRVHARLRGRQQFDHSSVSSVRRSVQRRGAVVLPGRVHAGFRGQQQLDTAVCPSHAAMNRVQVKMLDSRPRISFDSIVFDTQFT